jgi:hypothetical protein
MQPEPVSLSYEELGYERVFVMSAVDPRPIACFGHFLSREPPISDSLNNTFLRLLKQDDVRWKKLLKSLQDQEERACGRAVTITQCLKDDGTFLQFLLGARMELTQDAVALIPSDPAWDNTPNVRVS